MFLRTKKSSDVGVPLSPLIDCVFLLLIFFLVTSMLKKTEKQVPVSMPDSQLAISDESDPHVMTLGIDRNGDLSVGKRGTASKMMDFEPLEDLTAFLHDLRAEKGGDTPIQFAVEAGTEAQTVINVMDTCQILGFNRIFVRLRGDKYIAVPDGEDGS